jgi:hypothetical protein
MNQKIHLLEKEIKRLLEEKEEREAALPAHSIRPHQIMAIEELENEIRGKEGQLKSLKEQNKPTGKYV